MEEAVSEWRPVRGYPGYEVSDQGEVRSFRVDPAGRPMKVQRKAKGYRTVGLRREGTTRVWLVHHLVLETFVGPRRGVQVARHLDGDPANNALANLTWGTPSENTRDSVGHCTHNNARKDACPKGHKNWRTEPSTGRRRCRVCQADRQRAYRARKATA